ncbi:MAG: hypothetical protein DMG05_17360 [Acidobacteria bacterium]|nr:MAG: hypothetical protein DMG05_17360 [Acidobacteriota bacterium]
MATVAGTANELYSSAKVMREKLGKNWEGEPSPQQVLSPCGSAGASPSQSPLVETHRFLLEGEEGVIEVSSETSIRATGNSFHILIDLHVSRNGRHFFVKTWTASEPRRLL